MDQRVPQQTGFFWGSRTIEKRIAEIIRPLPAPAQGGRPLVQDAAYELRLGREAYVSGAKAKTMLDPNGMVAIAPGQIALLLTEERVTIPTKVVAFISLKTSVKVPGLINVSGFHVDPGFDGQLVFTVYNAGTETCVFTRGQPMFLIWFADLSDDEPDGHTGKRQGQDSIPADDISRLTAAGASPARLDERIRRLEVTEKVYGALLLALLVAAASIVIGGIGGS
jgi:dCTP deaminase